MIKQQSRLFSIVRHTVLATVYIASISSPVIAATNTPATNLDDLLRKVKSSQRQEHNNNVKREKQFLAAKNQQQALLERAKTALKQAQRNSEQLKTQFESNEKSLAEASERLHQKTGTLGELFGVVRQSAGDLQGLIDHSLISAQYPDRTDTLSKLASAKALPTVKELENLWYLLQQEMTEAGKVVSFKGPVVLTDGTRKELDIIRIGAFNAFANGEFLNYLPESKQLTTLSRQPGQPHNKLARQFSTDSQASHQKISIDPTRGAIIGMMTRMPSFWERIQQGGVIGYMIIALGVIGIIIGLFRLLGLFFVNQKIRKQLNNLNEVRTNNPLGRVLTTFQKHQHDDFETMEFRLDEAILKETPGLVRGTRIVKLIAAIAPLMGLLGTVTGMIATFQSITLFGTGDPKIMANGISQALVTTMLGLIVAVPLLFLHAAIASRSQRFIQILDEQSAGLIAQKIEAPNIESPNTVSKQQ